MFGLRFRETEFLAQRQYALKSHGGHGSGLQSQTEHAKAAAARLFALGAEISGSDGMRGGGRSRYRTRLRIAIPC